MKYYYNENYHHGEKHSHHILQKVLYGLLAIAFGVALAVASERAYAASGGYTTFGNASISSSGNPGSAVELESNAAASEPYAGVDFSPTSPIAWSDLSTLSTDYNVTDDDCGGGSPRAVLGVDTNNDGNADGYVNVAIGPSPTFTDCATGWQTTGNLIGNEDAGRYDFSGFGGSQFTTYSNAPASVANGQVVEAFIVVDGYWSAAATNGDGEQTILIDNINLNGNIVTFEPTPTKESCKNGGWKTMTNAGPFKNQGDCVSYFASNQKNQPNGQ